MSTVIPQRAVRLHSHDRYGRTAWVRAVRGFTLLELAITMVIVAVMVMWGSPSLVRMLENQRTRSVVSEFRSAFSIGRFESYGQGRRLVMAKNCALQATGPSACTNVNWSAGFTLFVCRSAITADEGSAENARRSEYVECVYSPHTHYLVNTGKQTFEGFNRRIRLCTPKASPNANFYKSNVLVFNPNGTVFSDLGVIRPAGDTTTKPTQIQNLDFFIYQERGQEDLIYRLSLSADGQLVSRQVNGKNIDPTAAGATEQCEPAL